MDFKAEVRAGAGAGDAAGPAFEVSPWADDLADSKALEREVPVASNSISSVVAGRFLLISGGVSLDPLGSFLAGLFISGSGLWGVGVGILPRVGDLGVDELDLDVLWESVLLVPVVDLEVGLLGPCLVRCFRLDPLAFLDGLVVSEWKDRSLAILAAMVSS